MSSPVAPCTFLSLHTPAHTHTRMQDAWLGAEAGAASQALQQILFSPQSWEKAPFLSVRPHHLTLHSCLM